MVGRLPAIVNAADLAGLFPARLDKETGGKTVCRSGRCDRFSCWEALAGKQEGRTLGLARIAKQLPLHRVETM